MEGQTRVVAEGDSGQSATSEGCSKQAATTFAKRVYDGLVTRRSVNTGDFVQPPAAGKGEPLFVVERIKPVGVFINIPDTRRLSARWRCRTSPRPEPWGTAVQGHRDADCQVAESSEPNPANRN
jgi:hypothetical protein